MKNRPSPSEDLLKHGAFVRGLSRRLTRNGADADDVEQDVWLAALKSPPRKGHTSLRAWFSRVTKNLVSRQGRSKTPVADETLTPRVEAGSRSTLESVAQQELIQRVIDCVVKLPEPYKTTVLLHFYEGLSVREIGEREGSTHAVVRHRLDRAVEMLKQEMDDSQERQRPDWRLGLAAFCTAGKLIPESSTTSQILGMGAFVMKMKSGLIPLIAVLICCFAYFGWNALRDDGGAELEPDEATISNAKSEAVQRNSGLGAPKTLNTPGSTEEKGGDSAKAVLLTTNEVRLEVVWQKDGKPAANVPLRSVPLTGWLSPWKPQHFFTDGAGIAILKEIPGRGVMIRSALAPYAVLAKIAQGKTGTVRLEIPNGIDVRGKVIDQDGKPVLGAEVVVSSIYSDALKTAAVTKSKLDGSFFLRQVAPTVFVAARHGDFAPSHFASLRDMTMENPILTLVVRKNSARLKGKVVNDRGWPVSHAAVKVGNKKGLTMSAQNTAIYQSPDALVFTKEDGSFDTGPIQPGELRIIVASEDKTTSRFVDELSVGEGELRRLNIKLEAPAVLYGIVRDQDGIPVSGTPIHVGHQDMNFGDYSATSDAAGYFEFACLSGTGIGVSAGKVKTRLDLVAGERQEWNPVIEIGPRIGGKVVCPEGIPRHSWFVAAASKKDTYPRWSQFKQTNAKGEFEFADCPQGQIELSISHSEFSFGLPAVSMIVEAGDRDILAEIKQDKLPTARIVGQVHNAKGDRPSHVEASIWSSASVMGRSHEIKSADGSFEFGPLAAGTYRVEFKAIGLGTISKKDIELDVGQTRDFGELRFEEPAHLIVEIEYPNGEIDGMIDLKAIGERSNNERSIRNGQTEVKFEIAPGSYTLHLGGDDKLVVESKQKIELKAGKTTRVKMRAAKP